AAEAAHHCHNSDRQKKRRNDNFHHRKTPSKTPSKNPSKAWAKTVSHILRRAKHRLKCQGDSSCKPLRFRFWNQSENCGLFGRFLEIRCPRQGRCRRAENSSANPQRQQNSSAPSHRPT